MALTAAENIALFTTLGAILVAVVGTTIPAVLANRRGKETADTLGAQNGHGTAMQMLGTILDRQSHGDARLARIEERQSRLEDRVGALEKPG